MILLNWVVSNLNKETLMLYNLVLVVFVASSNGVAVNSITSPLKYSSNEACQKAGEVAANNLLNGKKITKHGRDVDRFEWVSREVSIDCFPEKNKD